MMLLPFPQIDILPPKVVQCMLRNPLRNPYSPEYVEAVFSEFHIQHTAKTPLKAARLAPQRIYAW
jgi:hypothetical protein